MEFQPDREIILDDTAMVLYTSKKLVITYVFVFVLLQQGNDLLFCLISAVIASNCCFISHKRKQLYFDWCKLVYWSKVDETEFNLGETFSCLLC